MSIAGDLRRDADDALNNGGMYYSGEYLDGIAKRVEEVESENASLRGAVQGLGELCDKYKAENAKLRMCLGDGCADCAVGMGDYADSLCDPLKAENAKLRELVRAMEPFLCCMPFASCDTLAANVRKRMCELGIKEDE